MRFLFFDVYASIIVCIDGPCRIYHLRTSIIELQTIAIHYRASSITKLQYTLLGTMIGIIVRSDLFI